PGRLAGRKKAAVARHLPDLAKHALGGVDEREAHVRADVEYADLQGRGRVGVVKERRDLFLLPRIERAAHACPPRASMSATRGASFSPCRRPAKTVNPSLANRRAIAAPM